MSTGPFIVKHVKPNPAVCPAGHAMDDGLFECPACGVYREPGSLGEREKAVADLDEARRYASRIPYGLRPLKQGKPDAEQMAWLKAHDDLAYRLDGETRYLLPDGSEIHVEATTWEQLAREAQCPPVGRLGVTTAYVLWAWNERCGVAAQEKEGKR